MASLLIRKLEPSVKEKLRVRAALHGRSMEAEAREILAESLKSAYPAKKSTGKTLGDLVAKYFGPEHGFDLTPYLPAREPAREPPDFED